MVTEVNHNETSNGSNQAMGMVVMSNMAPQTSLKAMVLDHVELGLLST